MDAKTSELEALFEQGAVFAAQGRMAEAVERFDRVLAIEPGLVAAIFNRAAALNALGRHAEAAAALERLTAAAPDLAVAWLALGDAWLGLRRYAEALDAYDRALSLERSADGWRRRGEALTGLARHAEALASFERGLALDPGNADLRFRRANALAAGRRLAEAVVAYDAALTVAPDDAETWRHRGQVLHALQRFEEAGRSLDKALALAPQDPAALHAKGKLLGEMGRVEEGFALFAERAARLHAAPSADAGRGGAAGRHDAEQAAYLAGLGIAPGAHHIEGGGRVAGAAVNPANGPGAAAAWAASDPKFVVIDDLLTPEALEALRRYCRGSTVWRRAYSRGYLGAFSDDGFGAPIVAQIAEELADVFPAIVGGHGLVAAWAFKYDSRLEGIGIHADQAAVNVNFWITPDEANLDPEHGGMTIWDVAAPLDWEIERYNGDEAAIRRFLEDSGARPVTVPHRANRAVIFDSDLFHETDRIVFAEGYLNRRINVTLLYGRRSSGEA